MKSSFAQSLLEKTIRDYDTIAEHFSATRDHQPALQQEILDLVPSGGAVLDVGCGNGRLSDALREKRVTYTGIDVSQRMIAEATGRLQGERITLREGTALHLPFHDQSFDVIFAFASMHHIPSQAFRRRAAQEIFRVLKRDGTFVMKNWNLYAWKWVRRYRWALRGMVVPMRGMDRGDVWIPWKMRNGTIIHRYVHAYTIREMHAYVRHAGFRNSRSWYDTQGEKATWWSGENLVTVAKK